MDQNDYGDRDSREWWSALDDHRLLVQECSQCHTLRWAPRILCHACGSTEWNWTQTSGRATIVGWTTSHRSNTPGVEPPVHSVIVALDEAPGICIPGGWAGSLVGVDLVVDAPVQAVYRPAPEGGSGPRTLLLWARA